jgi:group I intron endonuclease
MQYNIMGYIYCITSPSGKKYIGQTIRDYKKRFNEHCKLPGSCILLENAIKKYGKESMTFEILEEIDNQDLDQCEVFYINHFNTMEPNGYNIRSGGIDAIHSEESRNRMRNAKLGYKNHNFGKPRTDAAKHAISLAKCGENHHFFGKTLSESHKLKLSESHKKYDTSLPMYLVYIKERPKYYQASGYAVINHPTLPNIYFTSKKISDEDKLNSALKYLKSA